MTDARPRVSVIIPTVSEERSVSVKKLREAISRQTFKDLEVIVVEGVKPQGRAINTGVSRARGEIIVIMDDDSALTNDRTIELLVAAIDSDPTIGMAGAAEVVSPDANLFQRIAARQFPRRHVKPPETIVDSDFAQHPCCALPKKVFEEVGGEREDIVRGLDPYLRQRIREAGYRVVLVPGATVHHPMPPNLAALCRTFFRNGAGSAFAQRFRPDLVYETSEKLTSHTPKRPFAYRLLRFPLRLLWALVTLKLIRFVAYVCYGAGYVYNYARLALSGERDARSAASR